MEPISETLKKTGAVTFEGTTPTSSSTERVAGSNSAEACPHCHDVGFVVRDVPVGHPDFGRALPCSCGIASQRGRSGQITASLSNFTGLERMTFERFLPEGIGLNPTQRINLRGAFEQARNFADHPEGWLVLLGGYGCGKTHLAAAIANERMRRNERGLFVVVPDLLDHLRAAFAPDSPTSYDERFEAVRRARLLILDDLGAHSSTPWAQEKLYQVLNYRYNARLPTVITTNLRLDDLDPRIRSRLLDPDLAIVITIAAPDFRRAGVDAAQSSLNTLHLHQEKTFESFDLRQFELPAEEAQNLRQVRDLALDYADQPQGWLVLMGTYGCGKTHLAASIAHRRTAQGQGNAMFVVVPDLLDHLRATFSPQSHTPYDRRFEEMKTTGFLVLDDLGTESATPWAREKLFQLLNYRYAANLSTVITTSHTLDEIEPRLASRMADVSCCTILAILAPSYRSGLAPKVKGRAGRSGRRRT